MQVLGIVELAGDKSGQRWRLQWDEPPVTRGLVQSVGDSEIKDQGLLGTGKGDTGRDWATRAFAAGGWFENQRLASRGCIRPGTVVDAPRPWSVSPATDWL